MTQALSRLTAIALAVSSAFALTVALPHHAAHAMSVTPVHIEMQSAGRSARSQVKVTNTSNRPLPVEIGIEKFKLSVNGNRKNSKAGDDFLVFPPTALIKPGASQVFRIQWVGEPLLKRSESYMVNVNQLPVKLPKGRSAVQIVMSFGVNINVAPPKGRPTLQIAGTGVTRSKDGKRYPTVTVSNGSNVHGLMTSGTLKLAGGSWSKTLPPTFLRQRVGIGLVQPGAKRRFVIPVALPRGVTKVQASLRPGK